MSTLAKQQCEACRADAPRVSADEQEELLQSLTGWQIVDKKQVSQLLKTYDFSNFVDALAFTNRIGELAENEGHHPAILTEWGRVTVRWWTHKIRGLHRNDFIMAAKTDNLL
jgi:4a-hydroxytetrahydrobiopterin dehydratase